MSRVIQNLDLTDSQAEAAAHTLCRQILAHLAAHNVPVDVAAMGIADVLGYAAAVQDLAGGRRALDERLHVFCKRAEQTYKDVMNKAGLNYGNHQGQ
jgi:hypothetical protein